MAHDSGDGNGTQVQSELCQDVNKWLFALILIVFDNWTISNFQELVLLNKED